MLVLSRKAGQKIVIGDNVVLTVVEIRGDKARLAFDAPDDVIILREELRDAIQDNDKADAQRTTISEGS